MCLAFHTIAGALAVASVQTVRLANLEAVWFDPLSLLQF